MKFPILGLVRLAALLALGLTTAAVELGRWNGKTSSTLNRVSARFVGLGGRNHGENQGAITVLDFETGRVAEFPLGKHENLDQITPATWKPEHGPAQFVGRWTSYGAESVAQKFGLARFSLPDAKILDRVSCEILPVSPPCWYPGDPRRVLFASGDGALYQFRFADDNGQGADVSPRRVDWRVRDLVTENAHIVDPEWSEDPSLAGHLLAGLCTLDPGTSFHFSPSHLSILRLNDPGTAIVGFAELIRRDPSTPTSPPREERFPTVGRRTDGSPPQLAYLIRNEDAVDYRLTISPIHQDPTTGEPFLRESEEATLAQHCGPTPPRFSPDGRRLAYAPYCPPRKPIIHSPELLGFIDTDRNP